ncbi:Transcriptional regulator WhiB [bioreactor metagenome]
MDWRHEAACLDEDPELFFPIGNTGPALLQIEEAKKVCQRCTVREECLAWALEAGQDHGVWGGMSEDERRAFKRRKARSRVRTAWARYHLTGAAPAPVSRCARTRVPAPVRSPRRRPHDGWPG